MSFNLMFFKNSEKQTDLSSRFSLGRCLSLILCCTWSAAILLGQTVVRYDPSSATGGPFPANALTISDSHQKTGIRIALNDGFDACNPNAPASPSACGNVALLNQLDGFSVNPRIMVCFSGAINASTLPNGLSILPVGKSGPIALNQTFYDPTANCAYAKPNQVLNEQTQYLFLVSDAIQDTSGTAVGPDSAFSACLQSPTNSYCAALSNAVKQSKYPVAHLTAASLFTTLSATTWMENARRFVNTHQPPVALPAGVPSVFNFKNVSQVKWVPQGTTLTDDQANMRLDVLSNVQSIAFGLYLSPNFLNPLTGSIATTPTNNSISGPVPVSLPPPFQNISVGYVPVSYHVFLPAGPAPAAGYPVVIYGHGLGDSQFGAPTFIADTLAKNGFATLAIEITGHGFGPLSVVNVTDTNGVVHTELTPGRATPSPGGGCLVAGAVAVRDCARQTAIDLLALVRTIQQTNGLGLHLDPNRIFYAGQSFGSDYGTLFQSLANGVKAAVFSGDGGSFVDVARLALSGRPLAIGYLASVNPELLNTVSPVFGPDFNDNYVFRSQPVVPVVNDNNPAAPAIQAAFESADWLNMLGDPLAYAPHLRTSPLPGIAPAHTLFQFGLGDLEMPNPTESAVIRAANEQSSSWFFRFDTATQLDPNLLFVTYSGVGFPILPHRILSNPTVFDVPDETSITLATQRQIADYFISNGTSNPDPNTYLNGGPFAGIQLFEIPVTLPESLNFLIPISE